jgi:DNA-directed RNA polymerase subunit RPC12/RpoP
MSDELEWDKHTSTDDVVCPYCGETHGDSWEWAQDSDDAMKCDHCGKTFSYYRNIEVTYTSSRIDPTPTGGPRDDA